MASCLQSEYCNLTATMTVQDMIDLNAAQLAEASVYQLRPARFRSGVAAESRGGCGGSPSVSKSQRVSHAFQSDSPGPKAKWTSQRSLSSSITDPAVFRGQEKKERKEKVTTNCHATLSQPDLLEIPFPPRHTHRRWPLPPQCTPWSVTRARRWSRVDRPCCKCSTPRGSPRSRWCRRRCGRARAYGKGRDECRLRHDRWRRQ